VRAITLLKLILVLSMVALVLSSVSLAISLMTFFGLGEKEVSLPNVVFKKFIITAWGYRPVMKVWFSCDSWPILVRLVSRERKTTIDELLVELPDDVPITMFPSLQTQPYWASNAKNVVPGTYYLRFYTAPKSYFERGELIKSVKIEVKGPDFEFVEGKIFVKKFGTNQWYIYGVGFKANNTGDSPAFIDSIKVEVEGGDSGWFHRDKVTCFSKGKIGSMSIIENYGVVCLGGPGRYTVWIVIDLGYNSWKYAVTIVVG